MRPARKQLRSEDNVDDNPVFAECSVRGVTFKCCFCTRMRDPIKIIVSKTAMEGLVEAIHSPCGRSRPMVSYCCHVN